jgi:hypothetical protein
VLGCAAMLPAGSTGVAFRGVLVCCLQDIALWCVGVCCLQGLQMWCVGVCWYDSFRIHRGGVLVCAGVLPTGSTGEVTS